MTGLLDHLWDDALAGPWPVSGLGKLPVLTGLLDHLWDDALAGPWPVSGLGKLRKHNTFSFWTDSGKEQDDAASFGSFGNDSWRRIARKQGFGLSTPSGPA